MEKKYADELKHLTSSKRFRRELQRLLHEAFNYEPKSLEEAPPESLALLYIWAKVELSRKKLRGIHMKPRRVKRKNIGSDVNYLVVGY